MLARTSLLPGSGLLVLALSAAAIGTASFVYAEGPTLVDRLTGIRTKVTSLESEILVSLRSQKQARTNIGKIQRLIELQRQERSLGKKRLGELEAKVLELETRRGTLAERIHKQQAAARKYLVALDRASAQTQGLGTGAGVMAEKIEEPRRKTLANLSERGLKEIEALKIDLADAEQLENRIQEEKQQLAYLFQDLQEQESILELNRALQADLLQRKHDERLAQLENYRKLKTSEQQIQHLIGQFNSRLELEREGETERELYRLSKPLGIFARQKGKLGLPVPEGKVVSAFGRAFDAKSKLYIFKKGIDILTAKSADVRAICSGKVAYSGELPEYGRVTILDHGDHFYTICAHLGELKKKAGDSVTAGDLIGTSDESGTPVYFEIRARNVAVNPLQWVSNESILNR